jgi:hypothetical protein
MEINKRSREECLEACLPLQATKRASGRRPAARLYELDQGQEMAGPSLVFKESRCHKAVEVCSVDGSKSFNTREMHRSITLFHVSPTGAYSNVVPSTAFQLSS